MRFQRQLSGGYFLKKHKAFSLQSNRTLENNIQPNLLRNWKKEFEEHAAAVFDTRKDDWMEKKLQEEKKAKEEYAKKVGQLTMQIDWLEKKSAEILGPDYESQFGPKPFDE